jgi:predicted DNA-binding transcriptional regulator AlpA
MTMNSTDVPDPMGIRDVSEYTGLGEQTIRNYLNLGKLPKPLRRFGRSPVWDRHTIIRWNDDSVGESRTPESSQ